MRRPRLTIVGLVVGLVVGAQGNATWAAPSTPPPPAMRRPASPPPPARKTEPRVVRAASSAAPAMPPPPTTPVATPPTDSPPPPVDLSHTWRYSATAARVTPRRTQTRTRTRAPTRIRRPTPAASAAHPVGFYSGVSVTGNQAPPFPAEVPGTKPAVLTWTGFERGSDGSPVFFQLSADVPYRLSQKGRTVRIRLSNTRVNVRNNQRGLDLRYFEQTPVRTVKIHRKGKDTVAIIELKRDATAETTVVEGQAGYSLLMVRFREGMMERLR